MAWRDLFGLNEDAEQEEAAPPVETPAEPTPQYATVEQMQQMVEGVASKLQENLAQFVQGQPQQVVYQQAVPQQQQAHEPTLDEINEAFEEGDTRKALQLQAQREAIREQKYQQQLAALRQEGQSWVSGVNSQLLGTLVPDYSKYDKDVKRKMEELGLPKDQQSNPEIVKLITNAVKGEKLDEIFAERQEAERRRANDALTDVPNGSRSNPSNISPEQVFSDDAVHALRAVGQDQDSFARKRGYGSWKEYEANAKAFQKAKQGQGSYTPKWKRNRK